MVNLGFVHKNSASAWDTPLRSSQKLFLAFATVYIDVYVADGENCGYTAQRVEKESGRHVSDY